MKETAQTGSVLGREFTEEFLATVSSLDKPTLAIALSELVRSGLLLRQGEGLQTGYAFKHALVQDAAYETLLIGKRKHLHAKAAHILEQQFPAIAEAQPELLARHYDAADIPERAVAHWQRAGTKASQASNYVEAERQLTRAIELVPRLPDDRRKNVELELQMALGTVYRATRGSGSRHTERSYARARELCEEVGNDERILEVVYGQCVSALNRPKLHDAERHAQTFMDVAERLRNEAAKLVAHRLAGSAAFLLGDFVRARDHLENCLHTDDIDPAALNQYSQGENTVMALTYLAWDLFALGCPEQAHARGAQAVSAAKGNSAFQYAKALSNGCYLHQMAGDYHAVEANMAALLDLAATKGIVVFYEIARVFQGWNRACRGDVDEGIELQQIALAKLAATEQRIDAPYLTSILAETYIRAGRIAQAQERIDEALTLARTTDERWFEAELHRLAGAIALVQGRARDAEACFNRALDVAKAQSARMWELRAATRLARLWMESGERAAAKALLLPVLNHFTEGHDLPDVMDAKAVLVGP